MSASPRDLRERVRRVPGMERLLPALDGLPPAYLVGGAVRDLLRGATAERHRHRRRGRRALGCARPSRSAWAAMRGSTSASARRPSRRRASRYNFATTRQETYDEPGALPRVSAAPLADDLRRRDFSINAMAVGLTGDDLGHLYDPHGGLADMEAGVVRVLHERSFLDDPTRLLRAVRYAMRLGFALDPETERAGARGGGGRRPVDGVRRADPGRADGPAARAGRAGRRSSACASSRSTRALHPELDPDPELVASAALGAAAIGADRGDRGARRALIEAAPEELDLWLGDLHLAARGARRGRARGARRRRRSRRRCASASTRPRSCAALLGREPLEALALAMALGAPSEPILRWVSELAARALEITGADLLAAGVPEGPAVGRALDETLNRKLDGLVSGRDEELRDRAAARAGACTVRLPGARA